MQILAIVALIWQRRRVAGVARRAWAWLQGTAMRTPSGSRTERAAHAGRAAVAQGWRALDTEVNAARLAHAVAWMRRFTGSDSGSAAVRHG